MDQLHQEIADFAAERREERLRASQNAAFFIISGIELSAALVATGKERQRVVRRIERLLERERLKGARLHWSYDLNRHIALKQALDRLRGLPLAPAKRTTCDDRWKQRRRPKAPQCSSSDPQVAGPGFRTAANAT